MGYELWLVESKDDDGADPLWFACGWDKVELFRALGALGEVAGEPDTFGGDDYTPREVSVERLAFIITIEDAVRTSDLWSRYRRIHDADEMLAEEWYSELSAHERADMALCFFEEGYDQKTAEVRRLLLSTSVDYPYFTSSLAKAVGTCIDKGLKTIFVAAG